MNQFQSTPSRRGWREDYDDSWLDDLISIHTLTQRVTGWKNPSASAAKTFQSTPSRRGWRWCAVCKAADTGISIHTLTQRVTSAFIATSNISGYFNPHPHAEGDQGSLQWFVDGSAFQSTPSRRGWRDDINRMKTLNTFQSTPSRRGWHYVKGLKYKEIAFQSTPSRRGWLEALQLQIQQHLISIHTLTQRVTRPGNGLTGPGKNFNPHPHAEGDIPCCFTVSMTPYFNPHPHAEGDMTWPNHSANRSTFQSTPSRRGWLNFLNCNYHSTLFQSTPSRRGWHFCTGNIRVLNPISIHTLTQRVTKITWSSSREELISIHTLTQRVTYCSNERHISYQFQSTPSRRGWHKC